MARNDLFQSMLSLTAHMLHEEDPFIYKECVMCAMIKSGAWNLRGDFDMCEKCSWHFDNNTYTVGTCCRISAIGTI